MVMIARIPVRRASMIAFAAGISLPGTALAGPPTHGTLPVQFADVTLGRPAPVRIAAPVMTPEQVNGLAPAPLPNQDIEEPSLSGPPTTRISPALLSRNDVFEGNGFSNASNIDHGIDERTPPAAGLNLFVPVK
jgi:hypothetical protein